MKSRPVSSSQIIVDPEELTEFLRQSQHCQDIDTLTQNASLGAGWEEHESQKQRTESHKLKPRPMSTDQGTEIKRWKRPIQILLALTSGLLATLSYIYAKKLSVKYHPIVLSFWQFSTHLLLSIPIFIHFALCSRTKVWSIASKNSTGGGISWRKRGVLYTAILVTTVSGVGGCILQFLVLRYLQVGDATVIDSSGFIFTIFLAQFFLNEKCGLVFIPVSCFLIFGPVVITRPPILTGGKDFKQDLLINVCVGILATFLTRLFITALQKFPKFHFSATLFLFGLIGCALSGMGAFFMGIFGLPPASDLGFVASLSMLSFLSNLTMFIAMKLKETVTGILSLTPMTNITFSFVFQYFFLGVFPDRFTLLGAGIVMIGASVMSFRLVLLTLPEVSQRRRICSYLLK